MTTSDLAAAKVDGQSLLHYWLIRVLGGTRQSRIPPTLFSLAAIVRLGSDDRAVVGRPQEACLGEETKTAWDGRRAQFEPSLIGQSPRREARVVARACSSGPLMSCSRPIVFVVVVVVGGGGVGAGSAAQGMSALGALDVRLSLSFEGERERLWAESSVDERRGGRGTSGEGGLPR